MSTTKHRNAGGPFVIFEPGLGISGSLEIDGTIGGRTGLNAGVQIATDTFVTGTLKVGANRRMSLTDNEIDVSSGDLTLDVAGNIELNADGGIIIFKDDTSVLGTITSAGFSGTATTVTLTDNEATNENNLITFVANGASSSGAQSLEMDGDLHYNPSTGTVTATNFAGAFAGNATSATALATGRTLKVNLESTAASTAFDGSAAITDIGVSGELPIANGGTNAANVEDARTNLGLQIGVHVQAYDADLAALAGLTSAADKGIQFTGSGAAATYDLTAAGKALLDDADAAAQRTTLGLVIGTHVQAQSDILDDLAGLTQASNKIPYFDSNNTADTLSFSTATGLGTSDTTVPSQRAVKTYVDNNAGGGAISATSDGQANRIAIYSSSTALKGDSSLTFGLSGLNISDDVGVSGTISVTIPASDPNQGINIGGYDRTQPANGTSDAALCIKQKSNSATRTEGAIAISTQDGNHTFFIFVNSSGNLAIGSDKNGTVSNPNGIIILDTFGSNTDDHTGVVSFTGVHRNIPNDFSLDEYKKLHIGKIVVATGDYQNLEYDSEITKPLIGQALPKIKLASKRNEKACFGVVNRIEEGEVRNYGYGGMVTSTMDVSDADRRVVVNSIGEGGIWVCNINGNLENGDYITTCEVPGLGMRQDSEMLCNYTVAKITQDCNFRINASNYDVEEFEFEGKTYRKAFVGCTYHCG